MAELCDPEKSNLPQCSDFPKLGIMSISEIKKMSIQERLTAMEQIWDSLCHEEVEPESPSWHENVLNERRKLMDASDAKYLTIEQLRERYR